jgi:6-pyruvoyltetrahydropterin/6-carboxytetrahydropterin synthase
MYRICKSFEIESGHMLLKHPGRCRYPHGHSRRIEVVLASETLDSADMVCDFKAVKLCLKQFLDRLDHALAVNSRDPILAQLSPELRERVVVFQDTDPTTEVLARFIFDFLTQEVGAAADGREYADSQGNRYRFPPGLIVERVRVGETSSSWAEYGRS